MSHKANSYLIPGYGLSAFDLSSALVEGENEILLHCAGPPGSYADILIADFLRAEYGQPEIMEFQEVVVPREFALLQNYPNPFNPETSIRFDIPDNFTEGVEVKLHVYNLLGQLVRTLVDEHMAPGQYTAKWDGRDQRGDFVSSSIYIYQLVAGDFNKTRRMVFLK